MDHGKRSNFERKSTGSSLALLESLAYDSGDNYSADSSSHQSHNSRQTRSLLPDDSQQKKHHNQKSQQEAGSKKGLWGWESRLQEAEEDLRHLRRRSKSSASLAASSIPDTEVFSSFRDSEQDTETKASFKYEQPSRNLPRPKEKRLFKDRKNSIEYNELQRERSVEKERLPGFGDRWASSVLVEEMMSIKKELQESKQQVAQLKKQLQDAERDKDNICRLWEEDRARMLGMKLTVESTFTEANERLRDRLANRKNI